MNDSMAQARSAPGETEIPGWRTGLSWAASLALSAIFLSSGLWKLTDAQGWAVRMGQAKVPESLALGAALVVGMAETVGAALIVVPRLRRWGAVLLGALLVAFMGYFAIHYGALKGADCSCVPWLKRVVGPGFFVGDTVLLAAALVAWLGARRARGLRAVWLIAAVVAVYAGVSYGVGAARETGARAPATILVEGRPYSLARGKVLLFYFDPSCTHCFESARKMARMHWGDTRVVGVPIDLERYAAQFARDTGLAMAITTDRAKLKAVFPYAGVPAGVALVNGRWKATLTNFDGEEPAVTLKALRLIE